MQRPQGMPPHLPPPQVKVGWNSENVVMVMVFGANEVPIPFEPEQAIDLVFMLLGARKECLKLQAAAAHAEMANDDLLAEAQANVAGDDPGDEAEENDFENPPVAEAVTDSPVDEVFESANENRSEDQEK